VGDAVALRARCQSLRDQEAHARIQGRALLQAQRRSRGRAFGGWQATQRGPAMGEGEGNFCPRTLGGTGHGK
jgi:hypothetical protein